jgi:hypothetical protein
MLPGAAHRPIRALTEKKRETVLGVGPLELDLIERTARRSTARLICSRADKEFELGRLLNRQVCGLGTLEHLRTSSEQKAVTGTGGGLEVEEANLVECPLVRSPAIF